MEIQIQPNRVFVEDASGNLLAEVCFPASSENQVNFSHTFISPSLQGNNFLGTLMRVAVAHIQSRNLTASVTCPVARAWFDNNAAFARSLSID